MKTNRLVLLALMILALFAMPVFAEEDENLEDMPTTVDETADASEAEPNMPVIKKENTYFGVVDIWGGYTTLSMGGVNNYLASVYGFPNETVTAINGGYVLGVDLGFTVIKDLPLALGLRAELVVASQGKYTGDLLPLYSITQTLDASLIPVMVGASYTIEIPESPLSVSADLYAGYSFAKVTIIDDTRALSVGSPMTVVYNGSGFALDIGAKVNYQINEPMSAGLTFGYRMANIASVKAEKASSNLYYTIAKDDTLKEGGLNGTGAIVPFDYSGFNIGVNVDMKY